MKAKHVFRNIGLFSPMLLLVTLVAAQPQDSARAQAVQGPQATRAASQRQRAHPDPDSQALNTSFFFFLENFAKWTDDRVESADPSNKTRIANSSAKLLGISSTDFDQLKVISRQTTASLRSVSRDAQSYIQSARKSGNADHAALASFHSQRGQIVQSGIDQLKTSLSAPGWQALHRYINGPYRNHVFASASAASGPVAAGSVKASAVRP